MNERDIRTRALECLQTSERLPLCISCLSVLLDAVKPAVYNALKLAEHDGVDRAFRKCAECQLSRLTFTLTTR